MRNYSDWLKSVDPQPPITETVYLQSRKEIDFGIDVELNLTSQFMVGHSESLNTLLGAVSCFDESFFQVTRDVVAKPEASYRIEGEYSVNGSMEGTDAVISGAGTFRLESNETFQVVKQPYIFTENGYIDISQNGESRYLVNWTDIKFEGLKISGTVNQSDLDDQLKLVSERLSVIYKRFINNFVDFSEDVRPPAQLLKQYLKSCFLVRSSRQNSLVFLQILQFFFLNQF